MISFKDVEKRQKKEASEKDTSGNPTSNRKLIITGVVLGVALIGGYVIYKKIIVKPQSNISSNMGASSNGSSDSGSFKSASFE